MSITIVVISIVYSIVCLTLAIWIIVEKKRSSLLVQTNAEMNSKNDVTKINLAANQTMINDLEQKCRRLVAENARLRAAIADAQERLVKSHDPKAIKAWLDDALSGDS